MAENSKIEWTHHTFNPWWGCVKVSPACDNCYAETFARRVGFSDSGSKFPIWGKDTKRRFFGDKHWSEPLKWNRDAEKAGERRRVFCGSMCDVMEDHGDLQHSRVRLYNLICDTPHLDWLLLTKRPQNFRRFLPPLWLKSPRLNVWGMTTVESTEYLWRVTELLNTPFAVRGLSVEPLLGPLDLTRIPCKDQPWITRNALTGRFHDVPFDTPLGTRIMVHVDTKPRIDWVIVGGESGPGARPIHPDWVLSLREQCAAASAPFFFKQWGAHAPVTVDDRHGVNVPNEQRECWIHPDGSVTDRTEVRDYAWPMVRVGKKDAGRLLDGRTWDEYPTAARDETVGDLFGGAE